MDLYGLVLMGGRSQRMGIDKSKLVYHNGMTQLDFVYQLLDNHCKKNYLNIGFENKEVFPYETIRDTYKNMGPLAGILSAFLLKKNVAWLICPIDMPFVTDEIISFLLNQRKLEKDCTCFYNERTQSPDPLLAIYEPSMYEPLLKTKREGIFSLKKCVSLSNHNLILPLSEKWLFNANTQQEAKEAINIQNT